MPVASHNKQLLTCPNRRGFSLVEVLVSVAIFALVAVGIYSSIQFIFKVVYQSRITILETGIGNEQIEIIRNMPYDDVGIVNGSPSGLLERTVTTTRNNVLFEITRTIRNVDDPYDGTIGGSPNDLSPADYKLIEVAVLCVTCQQSSALSFTTTMAPKYLEGDSDNGALFVRVFDANAEPVSGATVHIVSASTTPAVDITDTTNVSGILSVLDLPPGIGVYEVSVTKDGYTSAATMSPTESVPNPIYPPASVVADSVTEVSFAIDKTSSIAISTIGESCAALGNVGLTIKGSKVYGTDPELLKIDTAFSTNGTGEYTFAAIEWDEYTFYPSAYNIVGTIPMLPLSVLPDVAQSVQLILGASSQYSLLTNVQDSVTGQPLSNAQVVLTKTGFNATRQTGVGHIRQTDWSGGSGQTNWADETKYSSASGINATQSPGDVTLQSQGNNYVPYGVLESSIFDLGTTANYISIQWEPLSQPSQTGTDSLKFQIASSASSSPLSWDYLGPDGTTSTYYTATAQTIHESHDTHRYVRYKAYLRTDSSSHTPTLSDVSITYTNSCTPPGQAYFSGLANDTYTLQVTADGYGAYTGDAQITGDTYTTVSLIATP